MQVYRLSEEQKVQKKIQKLGNLCIKYGLDEHDLHRIFIKKQGVEDRKWTE